MKSLHVKNSSLDNELVEVIPMIVKIEVTYLTKKGIETVFSTDGMHVEKAISIANDFIQTGRVKNIIFIDNHDSSWTLKELNKYIEGVQTEPHNIKVYFDGGFYRKTNKAGLGVVIYYEQNNKKFRYRKNVLVDGLRSNNEAEYAALHLGVNELGLMGVHHLTVTFAGDSMVVINQLNEEWPCYEQELASWMDRIEEKLEVLGIDPEYELISRKMNKEADQLASQALNGVDIMSTKELE